MRLFWIILISMLLTTSAWYAARRSIDLYDTERFSNQADEVRDGINARMQMYLNALIQTKSMLNINPSLSRPDFHHFIEGLNLLTQFPGIQGIALSTVILQKDLPQHLAQVRSSGFPEYKIWPEGVRDLYTSILYIEPFDWRNQRAFGFDMYSEPIRRAAMFSARDSGNPAASEKLTLVQEVDSKPQPGLVLYVPLYKPGMPTDTVEQRKAALKGFISSAFRTYDLIQGIFSKARLDSMQVDFEVFDGNQPSKEHLLFDRDQKFHLGDPSFHPHFQKQIKLDIAGHPWTIFISSLPSFDLNGYEYIPTAILLIGSILTFLLFGIMQANRKELRASQQVRQSMTALTQTQAQLKAQSEVLSIINQVGRNLSAELNFEKLAQSITDAATKLSGAQFGALFYTTVNDKHESLLLYTLSGAPIEAFSKFPIPRNTAVFTTTFSGEGVLRSDDIKKDDRYGKNAPYHGMPPGHLPVASYLAVPVISRTGEVLGGLFFGHEKTGVFTEREEQVVVGLAAQAAIAIDNARLYQKSQDAIQARDQFLSIASHELKTPLTPLKLHLQIMGRQLRKGSFADLSPQKTIKTLDLLDKQLNRITSLVEDLLDVARISSGHLTLNFEKFDLREIVLEVIERFNSQLLNVGCSIEVIAPTPVIGDFDHLRVEQVVVNLLTNAMKYAPGKPIRISVRTDGERARLEVEDHGIGIPKEAQKRIFDRFERIANSQIVGGLGLGLFITRQIVESHEGTIEVESELGSGSKFAVGLPLRQKEENRSHSSLRA